MGEESRDAGVSKLKGARQEVGLTQNQMVLATLQSLSESMVATNKRLDEITQQQRGFLKLLFGGQP